MILSGHCNVKNADKWGYCYLESISSFAELCDEVIVVDGGSTDDTVKNIEALPYDNIRVEYFEWKDDWSWNQLGRSMQFGYSKCQYKYRIRFDADYVFHDKHVKKFRALLKKFEDFEQDVMAIYINKMNLNLYDLVVPKAQLPLCVNSEYDLGYGISNEADDKDFMYAIFPNEYRNGDSYGDSIIRKQEQLYPSYCEVWCYDDVFMTYDQVAERKIFFEKAKERYYGKLTPEREKEIELDAMRDYTNYISVRIQKYFQRRVKTQDHPRFIQDKIKNIKPDMFGWDMFQGINRKDLSITNQGIIDTTI